MLAALGTAVGIFALTAPTWFSVRVAGLIQGEAVVAVSGASAVPALSGVALVLLAAGGALAIAGRAGRRVVGALVAAAGAIGAWLTVAAVRAPSDALRSAVAESTGVGNVPGDVATAPWPFVTVLLAALVLVLGAYHLLGRGPWPAPGARLARSGERPDEPRTERPMTDPAQAWDALSDGDDPT